MLEGIFPRLPGDESEKEGGREKEKKQQLCGGDVCFHRSVEREAVPRVFVQTSASHLATESSSITASLWSFVTSESLPVAAALWSCRTSKSPQLSLSSESLERFLTSK